MENVIRSTNVVFRAPFQLEFEEKELNPGRLADNQVLVRAVYSLISPGTELALYTGTHVGLPDPSNTFAKFPFFPGYASVGEVVARGSAVQEFVPGDLVYYVGRHASYSLLTWKPGESVIFKVPKDLPLKQAAFAKLASICMTSVIQTNIRIGDTAVLLGMGLIGNIAAQLYALQGAVPIGIDMVSQRLEIARSCGIDAVILNDDRLNVKEAVKALTDGREPDIVVEATGVPALANASLDLVKGRGQVVLLGSTRGDVTLNVYDLIHRKGIFITGAHESVQLRRLEGFPSAYDITRYVLSLLAKGALRTEPLATHELPAAEAKAGYELLLQQKDACMGVLLKW